MASPVISTCVSRPPRRAPRFVWRDVLKRLCDVVLGVVLLALALVPMLLIALAVKLTSRGPVLYRQERVGLGGRRFVIYKFRTMRVDAEARSGPVWATRDDPRRTPIGAWLRRTSLDELPQLFNVLAGPMSLVGPRPERPSFVHQFAGEMPEYPLRHFVRPGMTGWAQVNGWRGDTCLRRRLACDLEYLRRQSLAFDLYIMLRTPLHVLGGRNAG